MDGAPEKVFAHYQELEEGGLSAPQVTHLMHDLKKHGLPNCVQTDYGGKSGHKEILNSLKKGETMIRDITKGTILSGKERDTSPDPRTKIVCTLLFWLSPFVQNSFLGYVTATVFLGFWIDLFEPGTI